MTVTCHADLGRAWALPGWQEKSSRDLRASDAFGGLIVGMSINVGLKLSIS